NAEVDPKAERVVAVRGAADVESVRIRKLIRIAVRGAEQQADWLAFADDLAADLDVFVGHASRHLDGGFETEELFDGGFDQRRIIAQTLELIRVAQDRIQSVAREVGGGFGARRQEEKQQRQELVAAQPLALLLDA